MQQRQQIQGKRQRLFTASELAEFEYCPLAWWFEQYEPLAQVDTEELFARLVALEQEHGSQAPALPEYQMVEQLLVRKGAFEAGQQQHLEHAEEVQEERVTTGRTSGAARMLALAAVIILALAVVLIVMAILMR